MSRARAATRYVACLALALAAASTPAQVFRWTDSQGKVHYGDQPPNDGKAKAVDTARTDSAGGDSSGDVRVLPTEVEWFAVRGHTRQQIRASMRETAPYSERRASRVWGQCQWGIRFDFKHRNDAASCGIGEMTLSLGATMKLPRWEDEAGAPAELQGEWREFARRLRQHEDGHKNNGIAAARDLARRLRALPQFRTCEELNAEIRRANERVLNEYAQLDLAFDRVDLLYLTGF